MKKDLRESTPTLPCCCIWLLTRLLFCTIASRETTYFLPSLLLPDHKVAKESSDPTLLSALFYSPILLWPSTGFAPLGMFPATVVKLSQNESWKLDERSRFRNRIRFYVQYSKEKLLHVELRTLSTHLEFRIVSTAPVNPRLIPVVRQELWNAITEGGKSSGRPEKDWRIEESREEGGVTGFFGYFVVGQKKTGKKIGCFSRCYRTEQEPC